MLGCAWSSNLELIVRDCHRAAIESALIMQFNVIVDDVPNLNRITHGNFVDLVKDINLTREERGHKIGLCWSI